LYTEVQIIGIDVDPDGNCGIYMHIRFEEGAGPVILGDELPDASREEIADICAGYRAELRMEWEVVSCLSFWQRLWNIQLAGKINLSEWRQRYAEQGSDDMPGTPEPKLVDEEPKTPDGKRRTPLFGLPARKRDVIRISGNPAPMISSGLKQKPTGKSSDPSLTITFETTFLTFLADKQITYKTHLSRHSKAVVLTYLTCVHGVSKDFYTCLLRKHSDDIL
jgi:hypothetical protein